jgi:ADP-heptose:LPS heptosyltransferase
MKDKHVERGSRFRHNLDRYIGCSLIGILSLLRRGRPLPADVSSIGVVMFGAIGDTLLAASIVQDLRTAHPFARIVAFVSNSNKATLDLLDGFDQVIVVPIMRPHAAVTAMRRHPVDLLIDSSQWARIGALLTRLARARFTVGFATAGQFRHFAFDAVVPHSATQHEIDNFRRLLDGVGIRGRSMPRFKPALLAEMAAATPKHPYVIFHPWASGYRSGLREWATGNWVALGKLVRGWGFELVITGGPEDVARATTLAAEFGLDRGVSILAGRASLRETTIKVGRATAVVSVNTGIMHLAALLDVPMIALHGPTNPQRWGPLSAAAVVVGPGPECQCGFLNLGFEYPATPPACMEQIDVSDVARLLRPMLVKSVPVAL